MRNFLALGFIVIKLLCLFERIEFVKPSIPQNGGPSREFFQCLHLVGHDDNRRVADAVGQDAAGAAVLNSASVEAGMPSSIR